MTRTIISQTNTIYPAGCGNFRSHFASGDPNALKFAISTGNRSVKRKAAQLLRKLESKLPKSSKFCEFSDDLTEEHNSLIDLDIEAIRLESEENNESNC